MIRPPPSSTLFPDTTLFRSNSSRKRARGADPRRSGRSAGALGVAARGENSLRSATFAARAEAGAPALRFDRTAEIGKHTSELQSQSNLVCRLLLEKKKTSSG